MKSKFTSTAASGSNYSRLVPPKQKTLFPGFAQVKMSAFLLTLVCFLASLTVSTSVNSQVPCPTGNCKSGDATIEAGGVVLVQKVSNTGNVAVDYQSLPTSCSGNQSFNVSLKLTFNVTSKERYGYLIVGDIYVDDVKVGRIAECFSGTFLQGEHTRYIDTYLDNSAITWECGTSIQLRNVYTAWDNQAPSSTVPDICSYLNSDGTISSANCSVIDPKCKFYGDDERITIVAPLSAAFTFSGTCPDGNTAQTYTFDADNALTGTSGGTLPYTGFTWSIKNAANVEVGTMTGTDPTFNFSTVGAGTYSVTLTVTDDNPTASSSVTQTITVQSCCIPPNAGTDGTLTVCAGTTPTNAQLFAAISGEDAGGSWSGPVAGVYTYTVNATTPCTGSDVSTVTVTEQAQPNAGSDGTLTVCAGTTPTNAQLFAAISGEDAGGSWSGPVAGVYTYTVNATSPCTGSDVSTVTVTTNPNALCGTYTGDAFVNTTTTSGGTVTVNLSFTIKGDESASCYSTAGLSASDFTITKSSATPNNTGVSIGTISYSGGVVSAQAVITLPAGTYSAIVEFSLGSTNSNYVLGSCTESALINVSTLVDGFVTGGGYILQSGTTGTKGGAANNGYKNNFGFNIKYNKSATKFQGNWNTIFRRIEGGVVHNYQVKSSQAKSLVVTQISATSYKAVFTFTGANMKDLGKNSATVASGLTVNVIVFDNGEPGGGVDQMYYEVKSGSTTLYATATPQMLVYITKGNIQIHTLGAAALRNQTVASARPEMNSPRLLQLKASPNPSADRFTLRLEGKSGEKMHIRVADLTGRTIEVIRNLSAGQALELGSSYKPGVYIVELMQGVNRTQLKLIKQ